MVVLEVMKVMKMMKVMRLRMVRLAGTGDLNNKPTSSNAEIITFTRILRILPICHANRIRLVRRHDEAEVRMSANKQLLS